jgi:hypothetical protein
VGIVTPNRIVFLVLSGVEESSSAQPGHHSPAAREMFSRPFAASAAALFLVSRPTRLVYIAGLVSRAGSSRKVFFREYDTAYHIFIYF